MRPLREDCGPDRDPIGRTAIAGGSRCGGDRRHCGRSRKQCGRQRRSADVPASTKQFGPEGANLVVRSKLPPSALAMSCHENAAADQSRTTGDGIQADSDAGGSRDVSEALLCAAGWNLCVSRDSSGFAGNLWRYLILRDAADAGDRHTHGPWSDGSVACSLT